MSRNAELRVCIVEPASEAFSESSQQLALDGVPETRVSGTQASYGTAEGDEAILSILDAEPWEGLRTLKQPEGDSAPSPPSPPGE